VKLVVWVAVGAAAYWALPRLPPSPRDWPEAAVEEVARLRGHLGEAVEAGKRAAAAKERELEAELDGRPSP